ncbi:MAG: hypothetical protein QXH03_00085 [Candidatus Bathyarchaeia archaeon]
MEKLFLALTFLGTLSLTFSFLSSLRDFLEWLLTWWRRRNPILSLLEERRREIKRGNFSWLLIPILPPLIIRDPILSPWSFFLSLLLSWYAFGRKKEEEGEEIAEELLLKVRSFYSITHSPVNSFLKAAFSLQKKPEWLEKTIQLFNSGNFHGAFTMLQNAPSKYIKKLASILSSPAPPEVLEEAFRDMEREFMEERRIETLARNEIIAVKITMTVLFSIDLLISTLALLIPGWRSFFLSSFPRRLSYILVTLFFSLGYIYLNEEMEFLKEGL